MIKRYLYPLLLISFLLILHKTEGRKICRYSDRSICILDNTEFSSEDSLVFSDIINLAEENQLSTRPLQDIIISVATHFIGSPYVANTLDTEEEEKLIVNVREFDCTTFVENVLAISFCIKSGNTKVDDFLKALQNFRYRHGLIDQYPSRLHYFSEWLVENEQKGLMQMVSNDLGDEEFDSKVNFISQHTDRYHQLSGNADFISVMSKIEEDISGYDLKYISAASLDRVSTQINDGDVIAFCSAIEGLDVSHTGIAIHTDEGLGFIHASTSGYLVKMSTGTLKQYIENRKNIYGILVGRPFVN